MNLMGYDPLMGINENNGNLYYPIFCLVGDVEHGFYFPQLG
jgi:hypothetical protein